MFELPSLKYGHNRCFLTLHGEIWTFAYDTISAFASRPDEQMAASSTVDSSSTRPCK